MRDLLSLNTAKYSFTFFSMLRARLLWTAFSNLPRLGVFLFLMVLRCLLTLSQSKETVSLVCEVTDLVHKVGQFYFIVLWMYFSTMVHIFRTIKNWSNKFRQIHGWVVTNSFCPTYCSLLWTLSDEPMKHNNSQKMYRENAPFTMHDKIFRSTIANLLYIVKSDELYKRHHSLHFSSVKETQWWPQNKK